MNDMVWLLISIIMRATSSIAGSLNTCTASRVHLFSMSECESEWALDFTCMFDLKCLCFFKQYQA